MSKDVSVKVWERYAHFTSMPFFWNKKLEISKSKRNIRGIQRSAIGAMFLYIF